MIPTNYKTSVIIPQTNIFVIESSKKVQLRSIYDGAAENCRVVSFDEILSIRADDVVSKKFIRGRHDAATLGIDGDDSRMMSLLMKKRGVDIR